MAATGANYAFDLFEPHTSSAAPQWEPLPKPERAPIRRADEKPKRQLARERRIRLIRSVVAAVFLIAIFSQVALSIHYRADLYEVEREIASAQQELNIKRDENVRLNAQLNSYTSVEKITAFATGELGMVKAEKYQIECIDLSGESRVLYTDSTGLSSLFGGD